MLVVLCWKSLSWNWLQVEPHRDQCLSWPESEELCCSLQAYENSEWRNLDSLVKQVYTCQLHLCFSAVFLESRHLDISRYFSSLHHFVTSYLFQKTHFSGSWCIDTHHAGKGLGCISVKVVYRLCWYGKQDLLIEAVTLLLLAHHVFSLADFSWLCQPL